MLQFGSVNEWLGSIKMARYLDNFEQAGIVGLKDVARLTVADLTALGITLVGHQKKIMNSIQAMRAQLSANLSEGFLVWNTGRGALPRADMTDGRRRPLVPKNFQKK